MVSTITLGDIVVQVTRKDIKNVHLSVYPPHGGVRIAAPRRMNLDTIRLFAIAKLAWIKKQQRSLRAQNRETPREFLDRESHYVWGKRYLLKIVEESGIPSIKTKGKSLILRIKPGSSESRRNSALSDWYREQVREESALLLAKWEKRIGVKVNRVYVQHMKTKWGSCNRQTGSIRLNTELAKKPPECLEYIIVHELIHFIERHHGERFVALMNQYMPGWRVYRNRLNRLPLRHEQWGY